MVDVYFRCISSLGELVGDEGLLRLPSYIFSSFVFDDVRRSIVDSAVGVLLGGGSVIISGSPGTGKTALMAIVLKELLDRGYKVCYLVGDYVGVDHVGEGAVIFVDDLPRLERRLLGDIVRNRVGLIVGTARSEELAFVSRSLGVDFSLFFKIFEVGRMSDDHLREMLLRYADSENVPVVDRGAIDIVVSKAQGLPVYVWQVVRELRIRNAGLTVDFAKTIPRGMYDYVDTILWRVLGGYEHRYEVLLLLRIMADLPGFAVHQDFYNALYIAIRRSFAGQHIPKEGVLVDDVFNSITRYLAREGISFSFRLPHDSWADVLRGMSSGPISAEIANINSLFPKKKRRGLLVDALRVACEEIISETEDFLRVEAFKDFAKKVFSEEEISSADAWSCLGVSPVVSPVEARPVEERGIVVHREEVGGVGGVLEPSFDVLLDRVSGARSFGDILDVLGYLDGVRDPEKLSVLGVRLVRSGLEGDKKLLDLGIKLLRRAGSPKALYNLGVVYAALGNHEMAYKYFRMAYEAGYDKALYNLAVASLKLKKFREARMFLSEYLKTHPEDSKAMRALEAIAKS